MIEHFDNLKQVAFDSSVMYHMDPEHELHLATDASQVGIGSYLYQIIDGTEKPIAVYSKCFDPVQSRWATIEQEAYAIYVAITYFSSYLLGRTFHLYTDHQNLTYVLKTQSSKVTRWRLSLQEYNFILHHIPGKLNIVPDTLSRVYDQQPLTSTITGEFEVAADPNLEKHGQPDPKYIPIFALHKISPIIHKSSSHIKPRSSLRLAARQQIVTDVNLRQVRSVRKQRVNNKPNVPDQQQQFNRLPELNSYQANNDIPDTTKSDIIKLIPKLNNSKYKDQLPVNERIVFPEDIE